MVSNITYGRMIILLGALAISLSVFFFWLRRMKFKKEREELEKLQESIKESASEVEEVSERDKELLEDVVKKIENVVEAGGEVVEFSLPGDVNIRLEASDVIALQTPRSTLHKSFPRIRFQKFERVGEKLKLYISCD